MQTTLTNLQDVLGFFWSVCTKLAMQTLVKDRQSLSEQEPNRLPGLLGTVKKKCRNQIKIKIKISLPCPKASLFIIGINIIIILIITIIIIIIINSPRTSRSTIQTWFSFQIHPSGAVRVVRVLVPLRSILYPRVLVAVPFQGRSNAFLNLGEFSETKTDWEKINFD